MLSQGQTHVTPSNGMWPLFCNEVGLSYDQEEKVRVFQKEVISRSDTWLYRHVSHGSEHTLQSLHDAILGSCEVVKKREMSVMDVLTNEQKVKFILWKMQKMKEYEKNDDGDSGVKGTQSGRSALFEKLRKLFMTKLSLATTTTTTTTNDIHDANEEKDEYSDRGIKIKVESNDVINTSSTTTTTTTTMTTCSPMDIDQTQGSTSNINATTAYDYFSISPNNHDAANLYILNHKLSTTKDMSFPSITPVSTDALVLKRLSRRPSFESLAAVTESESSSGEQGGGGGRGKKGGKNGNNMTRATSSGSLKRSSSEISCGEMMKKSGSGHSLSSHGLSLSPEAAQFASSHLVSASLGHVRSLIPETKTKYYASVESSSSSGNSSTRVNKTSARPRSNTITSSSTSLPLEHQTQSQNAYEEAVAYSQNLHQPSTVQSMYQPSSISAQQVQRQRQQQASYQLNANFNQVYMQQDVDTTSDMYATATPNTIQSSSIIPGQYTGTQFYSVSVPTNVSESYNPGTNVSFLQEEQPYNYETSMYTTTTSYPTNTNIGSTNPGSFGIGSSNKQNSTSLPILKSNTSPVPSPLTFLEYNNTNSTNQYVTHTGNISHNGNNNVDLVVDDSMYHPYDVGGSSSSYFNVSNEAADESLFELTEEDWAIGAGAFYD